MTRATRCDRCWNFECGDPAVKVAVTRTDPTGTTKQQPYDLCGSCIAELYTFLAPPSQDAPMDSYTERGA